MALFPMNDFVRKYSGTGIPCMVYKALARSCRSGKVLVLRVLALGSFQILMFLMCVFCSNRFAAFVIHMLGSYFLRLTGYSYVH